MSFNININKLKPSKKAPKKEYKMSKGDTSHITDAVIRKEREEIERKRKLAEQNAELERRRQQDSSDNTLGLAVGIATGIPINLTPGAIAGAAIHHSMNRDTTPSPSYDSGSSSSSYDSGSSSSGGGSFDTGGSF